MNMKRFCIKHQLNHGQKYKSCYFVKKEELRRLGIDRSPMKKRNQIRKWYAQDIISENEVNLISIKEAVEKRICRYCKGAIPAWRSKNSTYCSSICGVRIRNYLRKSSIWPKLRFDILARDGFRCVYCGRSPSKHGIVLHVDHWKPIIEGGTNEKNNLFTSCNECNLGKADKSYDDKHKPEIGDCSQEGTFDPQPSLRRR